MINQFRNQPSGSQSAPAAGSRRHRLKNLIHRPTDTSWSRRIVGALAAAVLTIGGGVAAAGPSSGAEPKHSYIVVLKDNGIDPASTAAAGRDRRSR